MPASGDAPLSCGVLFNRPVTLPHVRNPRLLSHLALLTLFSTGAWAQSSPPRTYDALTPTAEIVPVMCGAPAPYSLIPRPLPAGVGGRVAFYLAEYDKQGNVLQARGLGNVRELHPVASANKGFLIEAAFRDVDKGLIGLSEKITTTQANQSIEAFPAGTNTFQHLALRAIQGSDNTASDIVLLRYGSEKFSRLIKQRSPCTTFLLTSKAQWAAQGGLLSSVLGPDVVAGTARYASLPFEERLTVAQRLIREAQTFTGRQVQVPLEQWFRSPQYTPLVDMNLQYTSTAKALADLAARTYDGQNLGRTRPLYRQIMATGCCRPRQPAFKTAYWAAKAGSGWRILTLTGYVEMPDGRRFAYAYLNDLTVVQDDPELEKQIRPVVAWIERTLGDMVRN